MIAVDTNILIYAHRRDMAFYEKSFGLLRDLAESGNDWAIPWPCLHEFLSIVTHPKIFNPPSSAEQAVTQIDRWLECPRLHVIGEETTDYWPIFKNMIFKGKIIGPKIHDARIAAICAQHHVKTLWSADRDFSRMEGIEVKNPLIE